MSTFTIDADNNITSFPTPEEAAAAVAAGAQAFASQHELTDLAAAWPAERLVEIWNSLPGVKPVKTFNNAKAGVSRIWARIQTLGEPAKPKADGKAGVRAQVANGAPKAKTSKKANPAKKAAKPAKKTAIKKAAAPRDGSKTAQVVALLQRKGGATLAEITSKMGWQKHTVRGFMAGTMKKAGYAVESFKPEGGERTYRISK